MVATAQNERLTGKHGLDLTAADATITMMGQYIDHLEILVRRMGNVLDKRRIRTSMHTDTPWTRNFAERYKKLIKGE